MLAREGHDRLVDVYGLGLLLYEMVIGIPPFYSTNFNEIFNSVLTENVTFPSKVALSHEIKSLITKILMKRPEDRLGFIHDVHDILNHPWCKKLNHEEIFEKKLKSPFLPNYFQLYFEASKEIDEIKFLKDLQFEKNDEVLNEIYDSEENDKELTGFAYDKPKNLFLKKNYATKTHFSMRSNDISLGNSIVNKEIIRFKQAKNNHSTGHLLELKNESTTITSTAQLSPLVIFPRNQLSSQMKM